MTIASVARLINLILENWLISVFALAVFASLCLGIFKGFKHGVRAMFLVLVFASLTVSGFLVYYFVNKDVQGLIRFGIAWLPTIIFLIAVLLSTLTGISRGLRKSLIFLLHAVIAAGLCIGVYFFCITSPAVDKFLLDAVNLFMGENGLQSKLGVSSECVNLREVLLEYFNNFLEDKNEIGILIQANGAYILALINMIYRIAFAFVLFFVYQFLKFILYIIYLIFYSERKYRRKRNARFALNQMDSSYKSRPVGGGCVGLARGLVTGIVSLSFIGSIFFVATGGVNASRLPENVDFGNGQIISIYRSIESYGDQGIFKVLNSIRDPEDTPYYLYAADIVFSGGLDDELHGVSDDVKFRKELGAYTGFAKDTLALLMKYGETELTPILNGDAENKDQAMDTVLQVFTNPEFRVEFDNLIDNFDEQTYVINFALSLADAVIANIDDMKFMSKVSADNRELLQVMFRRGYLTEVIPDERALKGVSAEELTEIPPYLTVNHLFTKRDARVVLDIVLSVLAGEIDVKDPLTVARNLIPQMEELSILSSERSNEMDPVLCRLYCYFDNKYLTDEGEDGITYASVKNESVRWTDEIRALLHVSDSVFTIYDHVSGGGNFLDKVVSVFDEENENYAENIKAYDELTEVVTDSALIGRVLNSKKITSLISEQLQKVSENLYFPENIVYENRYDGSGNVINGELYHLLKGLRLLCNKSNKELVDGLLDETSEFSALAQKLAETITLDDPNAHGNNLALYLTKSDILRSVLSSVIIERAGDVLIIPTASLECDSSNNTVNLINETELKEIFDAFPELVDYVIPLAEEGLNSKTVNELLQNPTFEKLIDNGNKIAEATVGKALIKQFAGNNTVIVPIAYYDAESWISESAERAGELRRLLNAVDILGLDVERLMSGDELLDDGIFTTIENLESFSIEEMFTSDVFHYSISHVLDGGEFSFGDFDIIIPSSACNSLKDDTLSRVIRKSELISLFTDLKEFGISSDTSNENILRKLIEQKDILERSTVISASVVNFIVDDNNGISSVLDVPENYREAGKRENLKNYDISNLWRRELPSMIGALDEIFNISHSADGNEFEFTAEAVSESTNTLLQTLNKISYSQPESSLTRLEVCYASDIIKNSITKQLDSALTGVVENEVIASAKDGGYYTLDELRSLSETAEIFSLDILKLENGELADKVKNQIMTLTVPREDDAQRRSALDIMYPSAIIRYFITDEIDKALCGEDKTDEELIGLNVRDSFKMNKVYKKEEIFALVNALEPLGITDIENGIAADKVANLASYKDGIEQICKSGIARGIITKKIDKFLTDDVIDATVKSKIKNNALTYSESEIKNLVFAFDELGMTDFADFENVVFKDKIKNLNGPSIAEAGKSKLDVIYRSDIIIGAFTKSVKDTFEKEEELVYSYKAERSDIPVLRQREIFAIVDLLEGKDLENLDVAVIPVSDVRRHLVPDKANEPNSYLILANFSDTLINNRSLIVTSDIYDTFEMLVDINEALRFIDAVTAICGETSIEEWNIRDDLRLPAEENRTAILSSVIMRATFTNEIVELNADSVFKADNVETRYNRIYKNQLSEKTAVISAEQLDKLFKLLETETGDGQLKVPVFDSIASVTASIDRIDVLYDFDVTRYSISSLMLNNEALGYLIRSQYPHFIETEDCLSFGGNSTVWTQSQREVLTKEGIILFANGEYVR